MSIGFGDKPWMRPMQYTDNNNAGFPDRDDRAAEAEMPYDNGVSVLGHLRMESERTSKLDSKPVGRLG